MATIIFDFDDTLFDTQATKEARCVALRDLGLPPELFWHTYALTRSEYSHLHHAAALAAHGFDAGLVKKTLDDTVLPERMPEFVLPGAREALGELRAAGHHLILLSLSLGTIEVQEKRIAYSGLADFFSTIHVVKRAKHEAVEKLCAPAATTWFINDKIDETKRVHEFLPEVQVLLRRPPHASLELYERSALPFVTHLCEIKKYVN